MNFIGSFACIRFKYLFNSIKDEVLKLNSVELPQKIIIEENVIDEIPNIIEKLGNFKSILIISGKKTFDLVGKEVEKDLLEEEYRVSNIKVDECSESTVNSTKKKGRLFNPDLIFGIGGGKNIDVAKSVGFYLKKPWISIPTIPSHDGIASDRAVISKGKEKYPLLTNPPLAVIFDLNILSEAPSRFFSAGCGDVISKITSVLDWQLARDEKGETYDNHAADLAHSSAELIINISKSYKEDYKSSVKLLMKVLINCGIAMSIAKSSRPCSGSEHMFCHAIDNLYPNNSLHGEKVGLGTYIMAYLHKTDYEKIKNTLIDYDLPWNYRKIKIPPKILIKALSIAHKIRSDMRYTILRDGIYEEDAKYILKKLNIV